MKNTKIEVEGGEILLQSKEGHYAVIPAKHRQEIIDMVKDGCDNCINNYIQTLPRNSDYAEDGTIVSKLYKQRTGKDWSTAKQEGLTSGSYADNMKLRGRLLKGEFDSNKVNEDISDSQQVTASKQPISNPQDQDYTKDKNFNSAFKTARMQLGANQIFEYRGRKYGTNLKGEKFEPSDEVLSKNNMSSPETRERLQIQNKLIESVYSDKQTTKLEPEYQDWDKVKKRNQEINKMNQSDIIKEYYKDSDEQYLVLDKKKGKMHLYQGNKEIVSYNVGTGVNIGDEQTKTVIRDGEVMWDEGNKKTGAGIYTVSRVNPKDAHYSNAPTWNFKNEYGIEVPMALHSSFGSRTSKIKDNKEDNNRLSTGCINGICHNLEELYKKGYKEGQKLYVLPDDEGNTYAISNGKLIFKSNNKDVNRTVNTLNYKPIKITYPEDYSEELPKMAKALVENKQKLMKDLQINGDVYNDIAELTLGVAGQETDYGNSIKYKLKTELTQDVLKYFSGNTSYNSKGLTQLKYDAHIQNKEIKGLFDAYGITKDNLEDGDKAALAQLILFANAYKYELPAYKNVNIDDMDKLLYLNQGKYLELKNNTATPDRNKYIRNVKEYKNKINLQELN